MKSREKAKGDWKYEERAQPNKQILKNTLCLASCLICRVWHYFCIILLLRKSALFNGFQRRRNSNAHFEEIAPITVLVTYEGLALMLYPDGYGVDEIAELRVVTVQARRTQDFGRSRTHQMVGFNGGIVSYHYSFAIVLRTSLEMKGYMFIKALVCAVSRGQSAEYEVHQYSKAAVSIPIISLERRAQTDHRSW
ncbi:hypothetical protein B0H14DRAFT_2572912 [Mycena olivaceomarginata]|nr:hypothetical protein B0H14DRAFT_2572912 [Mycena olivaceomarginata]